MKPWMNEGMFVWLHVVDDDYTDNERMRKINNTNERRC
jgi:hypothetical protein